MLLDLRSLAEAQAVTASIVGAGGISSSGAIGQPTVTSLLAKHRGFLRNVGRLLSG